eukprot:EG_transcript_21403
MAAAAPLLLLLLALLLVPPAVRPLNHSQALAEALVACYDPAALGPLVSQVDGREFRPSPRMCLASRTMEGHVARAAAVGGRLTRCEGGGGLQLTVIGGSVSCGVCQAKHKDRTCLTRNGAGKQGCLEEAFPKLLEDALNRLFPCPRRHVVVNRCRPASGSDFHATQMGQYMKATGETALQMTDVVIVETTMNDVQELLRRHKHAHNRAGLIQFYTEALVRQLLLLPKRPLLLYLHASWRDWDSGPPYHNDAAHIHAPVLEYYHVPQVSAMAALQPLHAPAQRDWLAKYYFCDGKAHPTDL